MKSFKQFALFFAIAFIGISTFAQKATNKNFKRNYLNRPTIKHDNVDAFAFMVYTGDYHINQDTLRKYLGGIQVLKDDNERLSGMKYYSFKPIELDYDNPDIKIELALGTPRVIDQEQLSAPCKNSRSEDCLTYYYMVNYHAPAAVRIMSKEGQLLDAWELPETVVLQYGNEKIQTQQKNGSQTTLSFRNLNFKTPLDLDQSFRKDGPVNLNRKALLSQLRRSIESVYDRLYYLDVRDKFEIYSGKGKEDYSELDAIQEKAIDILEGEGDISGLKECISVWEKEFEQRDLIMKKSRINKVVAYGLSRNIAIASMYLGDWENARKYGDEYAALGDYMPNTFFSSVEASESLYPTIYFRAKGDEVNGLTDTRHEHIKAVDLKSALGKRKNNKSFTFVFSDNIYESVLANAQQMQAKSTAKKVELAEKSIENRTGGNKYRGRLSETSVQGYQLMLNTFVDNDITNKPMPKDIADLIELNELYAPGMKFTKLPDNMGDMKNLKKLVLKNNNLSSLPESMGEMANLKNLDLSNNQLTRLPESLKNCTNLKTLKLKGNNISADELKKISSWFPDIKIK